MSPPEDGAWDCVEGATEALACVCMPDGRTVQVPLRREQTAADLLSAACKVSRAGRKQLHVFKERKLEKQYFFLLELKRLALAQLAVLNVHIGSAEHMQQQIWFDLLK